MGVQNFTVFDALQRKMGWLSQRQGVLADNIANADTPGYKPHDVKEAPFQRVIERMLKPMAPKVTHPGHVDASIPGEARLDVDEAKEKYETSPVGNAVVLEEQLVKVSETQMDYQTMTNLYKKHMGMFRIALGRGGGQ
jgi:flagellar basal-body rod protein FlgB